MWNREGQRIQGLYVDTLPYQGIVRESRIKFGGAIQHTVDLLDPIEVYGETRYAILVEETEKFSVIEEVI